ncbi:N-acetylglucosamine-6-phosphate deacetylase [Paradevosia shaoguanensis]|uniref:N-acetylglucosamine-6-phosphate deacetylase n=1 Tax=Paradevosia shaoguanensis TaxID=1335043 RepID=UPI003C791B03
MQVKQRWTNVSVVTPEGVETKDLLIEGERFADLVAPTEPGSTDWRVVDGGGGILYPGMLDLLQHGFDIHLYNDTTPGAVAANSELLLARGVTGFLPSISCLPPAEMEGTLSRLSAQCEEAKGARAIGVHSEGPCFGLPGAHNLANIVQPSPALAERMLAATGGKLAAVTVSPELPGAEAFIKALKAAGVSIHLGHSRAAPQDIPRYVSWGIDAVTHMYNVMPTMPADNTGVHVMSLTDALLAEPSVALGLICDGIHVNPQLIRLLAQLPAGRTFLETDSNKYAGGEDNSFEFYPGYWVRSQRGNAVRDSNGNLCGSSLTSDEAMRNFLAFTGDDLVRAAYATSLVPARVLGRDHDLGSIEAGKLADFVLLDPVTRDVRATYVGGTHRYGEGR